MKKILTLALAAMLLLSFVGCGGGNDTAATSSGETTVAASGNAASGTDASAEKKTITVAAPTGDFTKFATVMAEKFMADNPNVTVNVQEVLTNSGDLYSKLAMMMKSPETSPDVITEDGFMINADSAAGYLLSLDDRTGQWSDWSMIVDALKEGVKGADGKIYGIPFTTDVQGIWYNKDLFTQAGISVPFEPRNWNDVLDAARKLKALNKSELIPLFIYASKASPEETSMRTFQSLITGTGASLYDFGSQKWVVDKANILKVLDFVNSVFNVDKVGEPMSLAAQTNVAATLQSDHMQKGKLGMYFSGSWESGAWSPTGNYPWPDAMNTWDFAKIPTSDGQDPQYTTMSGGWTWAIPNNAKDKDTAWQFLRFMMEKDSILELANNYGQLSVRTDVSKEDSYINRAFSANRQSADMLNYTHFRPSVDKYPSVSLLLTAAIESVASGKITPDQALTTYADSLRKLVGNENVIEK